MKIQDVVKTALDELRMQMLGTQVLFGFQLHGAFQDNFASLSGAAVVADAAALYLIVAALAFLITAPCQHRLLYHGAASVRLYRTATAFAEAALLPFALALGCDVFTVGEGHWGASKTALIAGVSTCMTLLMWFGLGRVLRGLGEGANMKPPEKSPTPLHAKIEQMLTEARVILPGAQALLGFQFAVTLTKAFAELPEDARAVHFQCLLAVTAAVVLLLAPAAVHRITFKGQDDPRFHTIGSWLVTLALAPLAVGISGDVYVATVRMLDNARIALIAAAGSLCLLFGLWYALPIAMRGLTRKGLRG